MSKMPSISPFTLAALIMGIGIVGIPFGDTAGKMMLLRGDIDPLFIAWSRYGLGIILVWLAFAGRAISLIVAFLGVLIVVRPGFGMSPGLGYALLGGLFYAAFLVSTRWLSDVASPRLLLITNMIMGTLMLTPAEDSRFQISSGFSFGEPFSSASAVFILAKILALTGALVPNSFAMPTISP